MSGLEMIVNGLMCVGADQMNDVVNIETNLFQKTRKSSIE